MAPLLDGHCDEEHCSDAACRGSPVTHGLVRAGEARGAGQGMLSRRARTAVAAVCLLATVAASVAWGSGASRGGRGVVLAGAELAVPVKDPRRILVRLPPGVAPGASFDFDTPDGAIMSIVAPAGSSPGDVIPVSLADAPAPAAPAPEAPAAPPVAAVSTPPAPAPKAGASEMRVQVPAGTAAGASILVSSPSGEELSVKVPAGVAPGASFVFALPAAPPAASEGEVEVTVPAGVSPGGKMLVDSGGQKFSVTVPAGSAAGSTLSVTLPVGPYNLNSKKLNHHPIQPKLLGAKPASLIRKTEPAIANLTNPQLLS